mmetsp:Transcript_20940/g.48571  ORF Transcript_20940/g.48571 Transcript_20940/m.48571 type:complete len:81 (+) Transcript_20940:1-243(+)
MKGAEAAYRAAISADPGYVRAHRNLGNVLACQVEDCNGDLAVALALIEEAAQLWAFSEGAEGKLTKEALARVARIEAALA